MAVDWDSFGSAVVLVVSVVLFATIPARFLMSAVRSIFSSAGG